MTRRQKAHAVAPAGAACAGMRAAGAFVLFAAALTVALLRATRVPHAAASAAVGTADGAPGALLRPQCYDPCVNVPPAKLRAHAHAHARRASLTLDRARWRARGLAQGGAPGDAHTHAAATRTRAVAGGNDPRRSAPLRAGDTVLLTGGAGFIGSSLARLLLAEGMHVVVLDDLSTGKEEWLPKPSEYANEVRACMRVCMRACARAQAQARTRSCSCARTSRSRVRETASARAHTRWRALACVRA